MTRPSIYTLTLTRMIMNTATKNTEKDTRDRIFEDLVANVSSATRAAVDLGFSISDLLRAAAPNYTIVTIEAYKKAIASLEDAEDAEAVAKAIAGEGDYLPFAVTRRLMASENPVLVYREYRNMTQKNLATASGIGVSYISQIENGQKTPSVAKLVAIADALDVDLDDLVVRG